MSVKPIGVFDSGLGGLTVFKALARRMPSEDLVYFGDTARLPYGSKSPEAIARASTAVARFLEKKGIKLLVVACNTSSAWALPSIRKAIKVPVIGVIEPGARAALAVSKTKRIGVIGTEATVLSQAYPKALKSLAKSVSAKSQACPLFVPLVEEGWWSGPVVEQVARKYTAGLKGIDTLILGCTHYPYLKAVLSKVLGKGVVLIDSAEETAAETERALARMGARAPVGRKGARRFFASDAPQRFARLGTRMLGAPIKSVALRTFEA